MSDEVVYDIARVGVPDWVIAQGFASRGDDDLGGQLAWHFATPWAFRAIASPRTGEPLLRPPSETDPLAHQLGYWTSLLYLMTYRLGWARPDRGLTWWVDANDETDDPTLSLIAAVWKRDGTLGNLIQWLAAGNHRGLVSRFSALCGYIETPGEVCLPVDAGAGFREATHVTLQKSPNGLHLERGSHLAGGFDRVHSSAKFFTSNAAHRHAVLIYPSMMGWYRALTEFGAQLPDLDDRSWRIDVVVEPVGMLGTYRRSRESGIWFAGRHSAHIAGT